MDPITGAFKAWDDFLIRCEDYFDYRVKSGKFIDDIRFFSWLGLFQTSKKSKAAFAAFKKSPGYLAFTAQFNVVWSALMRIEVFENIATVIADGLYLSRTYFTEYFIVLLFGLSGLFILLLQFSNNPLVFFTICIPLLVVQHLFLSSLYVTVDKAEHNQPASLLIEASPAKPYIRSSLILYLLYFAVITTSILFILGFSFLLIYVFDRAGIEWGTSILFWTSIIILSIFIIIADFAYTLISNLAYTYALIEKKKTLESLENAYAFLSRFNIQTYFFAILLSIFLISVTLYATLTYFEAGFGLAILFDIHAMYFLCFLLRRKFIAHDAFPRQPAMQNFYILLQPFLLCGLLSFIALTVLIIQNHDDMIQMLLRQKQNVSLVNQFATYQSDENKFVINYPQAWTVYKWSKNSISIYDNTNGTLIGGMWVNIDVYNINKSQYTNLRQSRAGLFSYDGKTKNVTTKISNLILQGSNGVKYTYIKNDGETPEYQTHYLVAKDDTIYDIDFVTLSSQMQTLNNDLFDRMMQSFRFIQ
jgi:hypothetical protein